MGPNQAIQILITAQRHGLQHQGLETRKKNSLVTREATY